MTPLPAALFDTLETVLTHWRSGQAEAALEALQEAIAQAPAELSERGTLQLARIRLLEQVGRQSDAKTQQAALMCQLPPPPGVLLQRAAQGLCTQADPDLQAARTACHQLLEGHPEHLGGLWLQEQLSTIAAQQQAGLEPETLNIVGHADLSLSSEAQPAKQIEEALQKALANHDLEGALALSIRLRQTPGVEPSTLLRHAQLLRDLGRPQEALEVLSTPLPTPALQAHQHKNRGEILRQLGDLPASFKELQQAVRLDPSCPDHAIALGFLHADVGAFDQGLELLHEAERLITSSESSAQCWLRLLQVFLLNRRGEYETALAIAQGLTGESELGFEARVQVTGLLIRLGDPKAEWALQDLAPAGLRQEREALKLRVDWLCSQFRLQEALQLITPLLGTEPMEIALSDQACLLQVILLDLPSARVLYHQLRQAKQNSGDPELQRASRGGLHRGLYEEFNTNQIVANHVQQLAPFPSAQRLKGLADLLLSEPESNAAALALLIGARQAGRLTSWNQPATSIDEPAKIPHRVIQIWLGDELPESVLVTSGSWRHVNPSYEHVLFEAESAAAFISHHASARVCQAYAKASSPLLRAGLFQLAYLSLQGGIVASLNVLCRHSLDAWLSSGIDIVLYQQNQGFLGMEFMAATPGQPLIEAALDLACHLILEEQGNNPWFLVGPGMLTLCFARYYRKGLADLQAPPPPGMRLLSETQLTLRVSHQLQWPVRIIDGQWSDPTAHLLGSQRLFRRSRVA